MDASKHVPSTSDPLVFAGSKQPQGNEKQRDAGLNRLQQPAGGFKVIEVAQLRSFHCDTTDRPVNQDSLRPEKEDPADSTIPRPPGCQDHRRGWSHITIKPLPKFPMTDASQEGLVPSARQASPSRPLNPDSSSTQLTTFTPNLSVTPNSPAISTRRHALSYLGQVSASPLPVPPSPSPHPTVHSLTLFTPTTTPFQSDPCLRHCCPKASLHRNPTCSPHQTAPRLPTPGKATPLCPRPHPWLGWRKGTCVQVCCRALPGATSPLLGPHRCTAGRSEPSIRARGPTPAAPHPALPLTGERVSCGPPAFRPTLCDQ